jgi:two-component system, NtrC family, response regulator
MLFLLNHARMTSPWPATWAETPLKPETPPKPPLLVVAGDDALRLQYRDALGPHYALTYAADRREAIKQFTLLRPPLVTLDLSRVPATAEERLMTLGHLLHLDTTTKFVVTGHDEADYAARAVQLGAADYLGQPVDLGELQVVLRRAFYLHGLNSLRQPATDAGAVPQFEGIIGSTRKMQSIFATLARVARSNATVLLQGESGTGKELAARAIHARSLLKNGPFVAINCGAIPEPLLEGELFGSERGAYTGAHVQRKGKLELAAGGTLFLDEIGEMSLPLQVKLLRFLQERRIERLGGRTEIAVDTRVIAASNKDLQSEMHAGRFREDLYYRLSVVVVTLPSLRDRAEDLVLLANAFLRRHLTQHPRRLRFTPQALDAILAHSWPGNVRELENAVHRAIIMASASAIEPHDLGLAPPRAVPASTLREVRCHAERSFLLQTLLRTNGNISHAARILGVSRPAIHDLLKKHRVPPGLFRSA